LNEQFLLIGIASLGLLQDTRDITGIAVHAPSRCGLLEKDMLVFSVGYRMLERSTENREDP
jgi:hypothetical protein